MPDATNRGVGTELPDALIEAGEALIRALDDAGLGPDTAFWMWFRDVKGWRLVLSGGPLSGLGPKAAHRRVREILPGTPAARSLDPELVGVAGPQAASVAAIRDGVTTGPGFHGIRVRNNTLGGVVIPAAYVYRAH